LILKLLKRQAGSALPSGSMSKETQGFKVKAAKFGAFSSGFAVLRLPFQDRALDTSECAVLDTSCAALISPQ
jgi:hypothetical protein